jgi:hypothetical protein
MPALVGLGMLGLGGCDCLWDEICHKAYVLTFIGDEDSDEEWVRLETRDCAYTSTYGRLAAHNHDPIANC